MWYVTSIAVVLFPICASASGIGGVKFPTKCGIPLTQKQVFDYIFDFSVFQKHVIRTVATTGFPEHSPKHRAKYVEMMRKLSSSVEDRLLGDDVTKTRDTLHFYADSLRILQLYQRIDNMLANDALLIALVKAWETNVRSELHRTKEIDESERKRMLGVVEKVMTAANVDEKIVKAALVEFSHLAKLANEMSCNSTYELFRNIQNAVSKSPELDRMSSAIRQAVMLTMIQSGDSGRPSREDFERCLKKICGK